jgi:hypothetical protein
MPHAIASTGDVAAFFFAHPLVAGRGQAQNKVLWVVRGGSRTPFAIVARSAKSARAVQFTGDSGGASGQIQRTILTLPRPGCWRLDLSWGAGKRARLDVQVEARAG